MPISRFPDAPSRIKRLPIDRRGVPVPWFVSWKDEAPRFPVIDASKLHAAWRDELCWVCGEGLGSYRGWVLGPMSVIEGATPEPPSHYECAVFSVCHCPHLSTPGAKYREGADLAEDCAPQANISKLRSGATAIWITKGRGARPFAASDGLLFALDEPMRIEWFAEGRAASLPQVSDAIAKGLPTLRSAAEADGRATQFKRRLTWLQRWLPAA